MSESLKVDSKTLYVNISEHIFQKFKTNFTRIKENVKMDYLQRLFFHNLTCQHHYLCEQMQCNGTKDRLSVQNNQIVQTNGTEQECRNDDQADVDEDDGDHDDDSSVSLLSFDDLVEHFDRELNCKEIRELSESLNKDDMTDFTKLLDRFVSRAIFITY